MTCIYKALQTLWVIYVQHITYLMKHTMVSLNNKNIHDTIKTYIMLVIFLLCTGTYRKYSVLQAIPSFLRFINNYLHVVNMKQDKLSIESYLSTSPFLSDLSVWLLLWTCTTSKSWMSITLSLPANHTQFSAYLFCYEVKQQNQIPKHWVSQKSHYWHNELLNCNDNDSWFL